MKNLIRCILAPLTVFLTLTSILAIDNDIDKATILKFLNCFKNSEYINLKDESFKLFDLRLSLKIEIRKNSINYSTEELYNQNIRLQDIENKINECDKKQEKLLTECVFSKDNSPEEIKNMLIFGQSNYDTRIALSYNNWKKFIYDSNFCDKKIKTTYYTINPDVAIIEEPSSASIQKENTELERLFTKKNDSFPDAALISLPIQEAQSCLDSVKHYESATTPEDLAILQKVLGDCLHKSWFWTSADHARADSAKKLTTNPILLRAVDKIKEQIKWHDNVNSFLTSVVTIAAISAMGVYIYTNKSQNQQNGTVSNNNNDQNPSDVSFSAKVDNTN